MGKFSFGVVALAVVLSFSGTTFLRAQETAPLTPAPSAPMATPPALAEEKKMDGDKEKKSKKAKKGKGKKKDKKNG
jgi:hypothetical protein